MKQVRHYLLHFLCLINCTASSKLIKINNPYPYHYKDRSKRKSSYPYITGDTFRDYCDHVFDETIDCFDPDAVKSGDTIFLSHLHQEFFTVIVPRIRHPFIIISHNGDVSMPGPHIIHLDNTKIIAWWGVNVDSKEHPKLHSIPIGLANRYWKHGNTAIVEKIRSREIAKKHLVYLNISPSTFPSTRNKVKRMFENQPYCLTGNYKPFKDYLVDVASSYFILSPRGNGIDCHRTWEALLMGSIPIVQTTVLDPMYTDLPVLIVNQWEEITPQLLEKTYREYSKKEFNLEKIYIQYWLDRINNIKQQFKKTRLS